MGRNTKLTKKVTEKICLAIRGGAYAETAAAFAGIGKTSFYKWLKKGNNPEEKPIYKTFVNAIEKAMADSEISDLAVISKAANSGNWQAAAWRLERKNPQRWGRYQRIDLTTKDDPENKKDRDLEAFTEAELRKLIDTVESSNIVAEAKKITSG